MPTDSDPTGCGNELVPVVTPSLGTVTEDRDGGDERSASLNMAEPTWFLLAVAAVATVLALSLFVLSVRLNLPWVASAVFGIFAVAALLLLAALDRSLTNSIRPRARVVQPLVLVFAISAGCTIWSIWGDLWDEFGFGMFCIAVYTWVRLIEHWRRFVAEGQPKTPQFTTKLSVATYAIGVALAGVAWWRDAPAEGWLSVWSAAIVFTIVAGIAGALATEFWSACGVTVGPDTDTAGFVSVPTTAARVVRFVVGMVLVGSPIVIMIHVAGVDLSTAIWLVAATGIVAVLLTTSNDVPVLLGVLLIVSFWATVPRSASMPDGQTIDEESNHPYFAVLGDSYISGEGADVYFDGTNWATKNSGEFKSQCRQAPTAWPMMLNPPQTFDEGDLVGVPSRVAFLACSGALTADIRGFDNESDGRDEFEQLELLSEATEAAGGPPMFVVVSVGGNDAQFSDVGKVCIAPFDCTGFVNDVATAQLAIVGQNLRATYAEIRLAVGVDVPVIAVPYPRPIFKDSDCRGVTLTGPDRDAVNGFAAALDNEIRAAAAEVGVYYMHTMETSLEDTARQLCAPNGQSGLNFFDLNPKAGSLWAALDPRNWTHNFIHPNERGHEAMTAAALRWLTTAPEDFDAPDPRCILEGACTQLQLGNNVSLDELAKAPVRNADAEPTGPPLVRSAAGALIVAYALGALLVLGWWLMITSIFRIRREVRTDAPTRWPLRQTPKGHP